MSLFELEPDPAAVAALERRAAERELSTDRRRTMRQHRDVAEGRHPLMGGPTRPDLGTCGGCAHRVLLGAGRRAYPKCEESTMSASAASDVRAWWPACPRWKDATLC